DDFVDPDNSEILQELVQSPNSQLRALIQLFISLRYFSPLDVPALDGSQPDFDLPPAAAPPLLVPSGPWWEDHVRPPLTPQPLKMVAGSAREEKPQVEPDLTWIFNEEV